MRGEDGAELLASDDIEDNMLALLTDTVDQKSVIARVMEKLAEIGGGAAGSMALLRSLEPHRTPLDVQQDRHHDLTGKPVIRMKLRHIRGCTTSGALPVSTSNTSSRRLPSHPPDRIAWPRSVAVRHHFSV